MRMAGWSNAIGSPMSNPPTKIECEDLLAKLYRAQLTWDVLLLLAEKQLEPHTHKRLEIECAAYANLSRILYIECYIKHLWKPNLNH